MLSFPWTVAHIFFFLFVWLFLSCTPSVSKQKPGHWTCYVVGNRDSVIFLNVEVFSGAGNSLDETQSVNSLLLALGGSSNLSSIF